jgi:hypothetical protein
VFNLKTSRDGWFLLNGQFRPTFDATALYNGAAGFG